MDGLSRRGLNHDFRRCKQRWPRNVANFARATGKVGMDENSHFLGGPSVIVRAKSHGLGVEALTTPHPTATRHPAVIPKLMSAVGMCVLALATSIRAQTVIESFEYASSEELAAAWIGSPNTVVTASEAVSADSGGKTAVKLEFSFPSVAFATETVTGPELPAPVAIGPEQYVTFRVKGDPAFKTADFRNLYLYAYDSDGNFGRWGGPVPTTDRWQVANYAASAIEKPWNSTALPDLSQIVRIAFYQYGSEAAIPEYQAVVFVDDVSVRDTPLVEPPTPVEGVIESFDYAGATELRAAWKPSVNATVTLSHEVATASTGTNALRVAFQFPSVEFTTETVAGPTLPAPISIDPSQYVSLRIKGDPAFAGADFRNLYVYAYDSLGNFGRWGAPVPTSADWQIVNFKASTVEKPWDSPALPNLASIVRFSFFQYGSQAAIPGYSATLEVDDLSVLNAPRVDPVPPRELIVEPFEYPDAETLSGAWKGSANALVTTSEDVSTGASGPRSMRVEFLFPSIEWTTESVTGPILTTPVSIGANQEVTFRIKGDPAFSVSDFRNVYLYAYDADGNFGRWGTEVPTTGGWQLFAFSAASIEKPWNSPVLPNLGQIIRFAIYQYGSQTAIPEYTAAIYVDEIAIRNAVIPALEVSGTPPTGMDGDALTNILVDEAARMITADVPSNSSQGYLTITPAQMIQSVSVEGDKLVVRW